VTFSNLTLEAAVAAVLGHDFGENAQITMLPPDGNQDVSDEEEIDPDTMAAVTPGEVAGPVEVYLDDSNG
jgi:hypothetical protein